MAGQKGKTLSDEKRAEISAKVVAAVKATKSFTRAAEKLNDDKVPTLGKSPTWYTQIVRAAFLATGEKVTLKPQRATKDKAPAATVKLDKGNGNGTGNGKAKPDPKPASKRSTAKRGGARPTATRAASAKRGTASKRSTSRSKR